MIALASDLHFVRTCVAAEITAVLFSMWNGTQAWLMSARFLFFCHRSSPWCEIYWRLLRRL